MRAGQPTRPIRTKAHRTSPLPSRAHRHRRCRTANHPARQRHRVGPPPGSAAPPSPARAPTRPALPQQHSARAVQPPHRASAKAHRTSLLATLLAHHRGSTPPVKHLALHYHSTSNQANHSVRLGYSLLGPAYRPARHRHSPPSWPHRHAWGRDSRPYRANHPVLPCCSTLNRTHRHARHRGSLPGRADHPVHQYSIPGRMYRPVRRRNGILRRANRLGRQRYSIGGPACCLAWCRGAFRRWSDRSVRQRSVPGPV